jgi:hypothetical protein
MEKITVGAVSKETIIPPSPVLTADIATPGEVIQQQSSSQDYVVLRFAVLGLMITIFIALIGVIVLAYQNKEAPDGLVATGGAAVGALATMIVRPPLFPPFR